MVQHLFPHFLVNSDEYVQAEDFWRHLWDKLARVSGQKQDWQHPWLKTAYVDGTPFRDGDPIFSAWSPSRKLGIRVIQNEPLQEEPELNVWFDMIGDEWTHGEVRTLVISCALSDQVANLAEGFILSWMRDGAVSVSRNGAGSLVIGSPPEGEASTAAAIRTATETPKLDPAVT